MRKLTSTICVNSSEYLAKADGLWITVNEAEIVPERYYYISSVYDVGAVALIIGSEKIIRCAFTVERRIRYCHRK